MSVLTTAEDLLTVEQVAQMMQVTPRTIRNRINSGLLPGRKMVNGKDWRVRRADVESLFRQVPAQDGAAAVGSHRSPLVDRLGTDEGRAHARAVLATLGEDRDEAEQQSSWAQLQQALEQSPVQFRRWNVETGERQNEAE